MCLISRVYTSEIYTFDIRDKSFGALIDSHAGVIDWQFSPNGRWLFVLFTN